MSVADHISPIVGYRCWKWNGTKLVSLNDEAWPPGKSLVADCKHSNGRHQPPHKGCECGIYAAKSPEQLKGMEHVDPLISGEVNLWGTVVEHEFGWRAQYAYPKSLILPLELIPPSTEEIAGLLRAVGAYGADIFVAGGNDKVRLWTKQSGTNPGGVDWLRSKRKRRQVPENAPIVGCSAWRWNASGLMSCNFSRWNPGEPRPARRSGDRSTQHEAFKSLEQLREAGFSFRWRALYGEIALWGWVFETEVGWQAEFAYPRTLVVPPEMTPLNLEEVQLLVQAVGPYGVDIFLAHREDQIRIWERTSGIDQAGIDWLKCHRWKVVPEASPITAYRKWEWGPYGLTSYPDHRWVPGQATSVADHGDCLEVFAAVKNSNDLHEQIRRWRKFGISECSILGDVSLWGNVLEYKQGWRAQFAYPRNLTIPPEIIPLDTKKADLFLDAVTAYGADVFVANGQDRVRLWDRNSGYDRAGLDYFHAIASCRLTAAVPIALVTDNQNRQVLLEQVIESTQGRIVFCHIGFPIGSEDSVLHEIQDSGAKIVVVDVNTTDPHPCVHSIEVIRAVTKLVSIIAIVESSNHKDLIAVMQAGAHVVSDANSRRDWRHAFRQILGPQLIEHTKVGDIPASWRCSACNEVFELPADLDLAIGLHDAMRAWVEHLNAKHEE